MNIFFYMILGPWGTAPTTTLGNARLTDNRNLIKLKKCDIYEFLKSECIEYLLGIK